MAATIACFALAGCLRQLDEVDGIFDAGGGDKVMCAASLDDEAHNDAASANAALDRAMANDEVVFLYGHTPGAGLDLDKLDAVLDHANELGLPFVTFRELAEGAPHRAALSLSLDDAAIDAWYDAEDLLLEHAATVTFFVTRYQNFSDEDRAKLAELSQLGHDVEAHGQNHVRAPAYVEDHGLQAWLDDEILPNLELLRADGYDPLAYAYPFGARTSETDAALLPYFRILRSVSFSTGVPIVVDPCPR